MLKELIDKVESTGGATYNYLNNYYPSTSYVVSIHKDREHRVCVLNEGTLIEYIHTNYDLLTDRDNCLGIWWNPADCVYYIDVVTVVANYLKAVRLARENKQEAIYDLDTGNTITMEETLPEFEFDELHEPTQEQCIVDYLKSSTMYEVAIDDLRHMKFGVNGNIVRGYDE